MYAVIASGGKQYRVSKGDILRLEKLEGDIGSDLIFSNVLLLADDENLQIGQPMVKDAIVKAHIVEQDRAKKIIVFKYKRRKRFRRKRGHRQYYTAIKVDSIGINSEINENSENSEAVIASQTDENNVVQSENITGEETIQESVTQDSQELEEKAKME